MGGEVSNLKLVKILLDKGFYDKYKHRITKELFDGDSNVRDIFKTLEKAYETTTTNLTVDSLKELHYSFNPTITSANKRVLEELFAELTKLDITKEVSEEILKTAIQQELWTDLWNIAADGADNKQVDFSEAQEILDKIKEGINLDRDVNVITGSVEEMITATDQQLKYKIHIRTIASLLEGIGKGTFTTVNGRPNSGKCLGKNTPILMYDGTIKLVQDIKKGDKLMGPDSTPRMVLSTTSGKENLYEINYKWGEKYIVNESHILSLKRSNKEGVHKYGQILNVPISEYINWPEGRKQRYKGWKIGVEFNENLVELLPIPPYILGIWLGDGHSDKPSFTNTDKEIIDEIKHYASQEFCNIRQEKNYPITHNITKRKGLTNPVLNLLRGLNLIKNKHIPQIYKVASKIDRLELLAGIIDTDGSYDNTKFCYEVTQKNKILAEDIVFLARSLGLHARKKACLKSATNGREGNIGKYYRIHISGNIHEIPCKLKRKKALKTNSKRKNLHFGISVKPIGIGEYYGFEIDKDKLFVLGDFTVTHNTSFVVSLISQPQGFLSQKANVLYIGNEEKAVRTRLRMACCYAGVSRDDLTNPLKVSLANEKFKEIESYLTVLDMAGYSIEELEKHLKNNKDKYDVLVVDQLDKLSINGEYAHEADRIRRLYTTTREVLKKYDLAGIGVGQASVDAENKEVFGFDCLENSKTGKAAEVDVCMCIGFRRNDDGTIPAHRTVNLAKNKLTGNENYATVNVDFGSDPNLPKIGRWTA